MRTWGTAREWVEERLPGLPATESACIRRAGRERWDSRPRAASGGGREYHVSALPAEARAELLRRTADVQPAQLPMQAVGRPTAHLADWQRRTMDARAAILALVQSKEALVSRRQAILSVVADARSGALSPAYRELVRSANARGGRTGSRKLSPSSIYDWFKAAERDIAALAPAAPPPTGAPPWADAFHKEWNGPTKRKLAEVARTMGKHLPPGVVMPSYAALRRYLNALPVMEREEGRHGPNGMLQFLPYKHRSVEGLEPMATVTADGHTFKAWVQNPRSGRPFNPEVAVVMDTATRYILGFSTALAESSEAVRAAIRHAVERFGLFALFYTDNGSGFIARAMTSGTVGLLGRIGATPENSTPGRAQARGKIEAFMKVLRAAARKLPTYTGRDMDREFKKRLEKQISKDIKASGTSRRVISWEEFSTFLASEIESYNRRPHRGLPKFTDGNGKRRHMSPHDAMESWRAQGWTPAMAPASMLDELFRPCEERTVSRGIVPLGDAQYFAAELAQFHGRRVRVGYDQHDPSRVWVRTLEDDRFICEATLNGHHTLQHPRAMVQIAQDKRNDRQLKLLREHAEAIEAERRGYRVIEQGPDDAPAITLAALGVAHAETVRRFEQPAPQAVAQLEPEERWYQRALHLQAERDAGISLSETDAEWLAHAQTRPWFQARAAAELSRAAFFAAANDLPPDNTTPPMRKSG